MAESDATSSEATPSGEEGPARREKRDIPDGLWLRCEGCEEMLYRKTVAENLDICPECGFHFRLSGRRRLDQLVDPDTFEELFGDVVTGNPLDFSWGGQTYDAYIRDYQARTGASEGVLTGMAYIKGRRVALGVMDGEFIMGSVGSAVGERITLLIERAAEQCVPLVMVCTSGGMRMQEGALSLMQMAKTSAALARLDQQGGLYIAVLIDPTYGGTTASFGMLADIVLAEPGAMIGFAGQRVIANTIKAELPEGFQRAEFLLDHGFIDRIVPRGELRSEIARLIDYCRRPA